MHMGPEEDALGETNDDPSFFIPRHHYTIFYDIVLTYEQFESEIRLKQKAFCLIFSKYSNTVHCPLGLEIFDIGIATSEPKNIKMNLKSENGVSL